MKKIIEKKWINKRQIKRNIEKNVVEFISLFSWNVKKASVKSSVFPAGTKKEFKKEKKGQKCRQDFLGYLKNIFSLMYKHGEKKKLTKIINKNPEQKKAL